LPFLAPAGGLNSTVRDQFSPPPVTIPEPGDRSHHPIVLRERQDHGSASV